MKKLLFLSGLIILISTYSGIAQEDSIIAGEKTSEGIDSVRKNKIKIYPGFGVSLIRNEIVPAFYINLGVNHKDRYEINVNTSSFFFFEREASKNYNIYRNTFKRRIPIKFHPFEQFLKSWNGFGVGYLIESKGQYFRDATFNIYYKRKLRYISILPGIMLADDFKDVFPVISIKL